jgi:hypothetical protein
MLHNGSHYTDRIAMILVYGNVTPQFFLANISERRILEKTALVTKSMGPVLIEVNDRPVIDYFADLGLVKASETQYGMVSLPFLMDYNDGTPKVSKIVVMLTPEKYAVCAGIMPEGSTLYMSVIDKDDVLHTTNEVTNAILQSLENASCLLAYSCICRSMSMGFEQFKEMDLCASKMLGKIPYMLVNSGGEICPTLVTGGKAINRFHNNAFIVCVL